MRRAIDPRNPFRRVPRFAFGYEWIPQGARLLDYGCHDGAFGRELLRHRSVDYVGVDRSREAVARAPEGLQVLHLPDARLPFPDGAFDVATLFEVLEHVHDQDRLLGEIRRVLRTGGRLIVSVPRQHAFSWLDLANLKFSVPGLHRLYTSLRGSRQAYRERYEAHRDGLVGDIEREKAWHQHFEDGEMRELLERNGFQVEELDGAGLFSACFDLFSTVFRLGFLFPQSLRSWDDYRFHSRMLFCSARRA